MVGGRGIRRGARRRWRQPLRAARRRRTGRVRRRCGGRRRGGGECGCCVGGRDGRMRLGREERRGGRGGRRRGWRGERRERAGGGTRGRRGRAGKRRGGRGPLRSERRETERGGGSECECNVEKERMTWLPDKGRADGDLDPFCTVFNHHSRRLFSCAKQTERWGQVIRQNHLVPGHPTVGGQTNRIRLTVIFHCQSAPCHTGMSIEHEQPIGACRHRTSISVQYLYSYQYSMICALRSSSPAHQGPSTCIPFCIRLDVLYRVPLGTLEGYRTYQAYDHTRFDVAEPYREELRSSIPEARSSQFDVNPTGSSQTCPPSCSCSLRYSPWPPTPQHHRTLRTSSAYH